MRASKPIKRSCSPSGFRHFEPLMTFTEAEDTGLLSFYVLYSPPRLRKLSRVEMLLRTRSLIMILLLIGCVESHPGEFYKYYFYYSSHAVYRYMYLKTYAKFTFCIKSQRHVSDENFLYYRIHLAGTVSPCSV